MYKDFYGFREKPFNIVSDPGLLYLSEKHRMALHYLEYGVMNVIGFMLLTGEIGTGKTTIIKRFFRQIRDEIDVAVVFNTNASSEQLLELILDEFELDLPNGGKVAYLNTLNRYLLEKHSLDQRVLLIVDEAQSLTEEALEEIRMLNNLQTDKDFLLQILLVGQTSLAAKLNRPSLKQFGQRIGLSYHLRPLSLEETREYIAHRLNAAGSKQDQLFSREAVERIFFHARGIPRTINLLCDAALVYGYAGEQKHIDWRVIESVMKDKQEHSLVDSSQDDVDLSQGGEGAERIGRAGRLEHLEKRMKTCCRDGSAGSGRGPEKEDGHRQIT